MLIKLKLWAAGLGAVVLALAGAFLMGRFKQSALHKVQELKAYKTTRKDMDDAESFNTPDPATKFLRKRESKRDL
jgi:hypothetical protein